MTPPPLLPRPAAALPCPAALHTDPLQIALTRMAGLAGGVATMMLLSVVVLPKSATVEVLHT